MTGSGGQGALTWGAVTGVPAGLTPSRVGDVLVLTGTPTETGSFTLRVTITDEAATSADLAQQIAINPPVSLTTTSLAEATMGRPWAQPLAAENGAPAYVWRLTGSPPAWISIDGATGALSGTPPTDDDVSVTVEVEGAAGSKDSNTFDLTVNPSLMVIERTFPVATPGEAYAESIQVTGGTAPISTSLQSGSIPPGLSLTGAEIAGTPTAAGYFEAIVTVSDTWGASVTVAARITVARKGTIGARIEEFDLTADGQAAWLFDVVAGTKLKAKIKTDGDPNALGVQLLYTDGTIVDLTANLTAGSTKVKIGDLVLPKTGRVVLILTNASDATRKIEAKVKGKASSGLSDTFFFGPDSGRMEVPFAALPGSRLKVTVKSKGGDDVPPAEFVELLGPDDGAVNVAATFKPKSTGFKFGKTTLALGGDYVLAFRPGVGTAQGTAKVKVKISRPDGYTFTYDATPASPLRVAPRTSFLLFRDEFEGEVSGLWVEEGARLVPGRDGARLVSDVAGGRVSVGDEAWNVSEAHVSLAGEGPIEIVFRSEAGGGFAVRLTARRVAVFEEDRLIAEAPLSAAGSDGRRVSLMREGDAIAIAVDGRVVLEVPSGSPVTGLALRAHPAFQALQGTAPVLESVILLGD